MAANLELSRLASIRVCHRSWSRRSFGFAALVPVPLIVTTGNVVQAAEEVSTSSKDDKADAGGLLDGILSIFDPNETTKSGKTLPKSYLKAAREVVKNLRDALQKDRSKDEQKFRDAANSARDAIREYLTGWKGSKAVESQESYQELEKALRQLGNFYLKSGPTAVMPDDIKSQILQYLGNAEADL